MTESLI